MKHKLEITIGLSGLILSTLGFLIGTATLNLLGLVIGAVGFGMLLR